MLKAHKIIVAAATSIILLNSGLALAGQARHHVRKLDHKIQRQKRNTRALNHMANQQQRKTEAAMRSGDIIGAMKHQQKMNEIRESEQHERFQTQQLRQRRNHIIRRHHHQF